MFKNEELIKYFFPEEGERKPINDTKFVTTSRCKKLFFQDFFNTPIPCDCYDAVVSGAGKEEDKIDTFYSSSLQSLLFFCNVSKKHPLIYREVKYTKVVFEWKNPVISFPSSIDVVLIGEKETGEKKTKRVIMFIESKLYEVIRDSDTSGTHEIGSSYFKQKNGYTQRLGLNEKDYHDLGIVKDDVNSKKQSLIKPIDKNSYIENGEKKNGFVYSYGIKQMLSHIIGILRFKDEPKARYPREGEYFKNYVKENNYDIFFLTLINGMPGFNDTDADAQKKLRDFKNHYDSVIDLLTKEHSDKLPGIELLPCTTYQAFYKEVKKEGYKLSETIEKYYHLEEKSDLDEKSSHA